MKARPDRSSGSSGYGPASNGDLPTSFDGNGAPFGGDFGDGESFSRGVRPGAFRRVRLQIPSTNPRPNPAIVNIGDVLSRESAQTPISPGTTICNEMEIPSWAQAIAKAIADRSSGGVLT